MTICDIIKLANKEYEANGRSEKYIKLEQRMLRSNNALSIYFFARYVNGIDVDAFQNAILNLGDMAVARYFAEYVPNADINIFYQYAKANGLHLWAEVFMEIFDIKTEPKPKERAKKKHERLCDSEEKSLGDIRLEALINNANKEYRKNGRSAKFVEIETRAIHATSPGDMFLFAKNVRGVSSREMEKALLMGGNPRRITVCALNLEGLSEDILLMGLDIMKNDHEKLKKDKLREINLNRLYNQLEKAKENNDEEDIKIITQEINEESKKFTYLDEINFCKSQIKEHYSHKK